MKCRLKLINDNWYAENLGGTSYLEPYNFLREGELYKVYHSTPRLLKDGKEVECEFVQRYTNPELYRDMSLEEGELYVKVLSLARLILRDTPPEVRDKVKNRVNLDEAIEYVIKSQADDYLSTPYLLLENVQEIIKILTGIEVPLDDLIYKQ